jgi:high-affinity iron transporter
MFLSSVILALQEMLEAALLISFLLIFTHLLLQGSAKIDMKSEVQSKKSVKTIWVAYAIFFGVVGAWIYASIMPQISQWFDYVGQEVVNASIQIIILFFLILFSNLVLKPQKSTLIAISMISIVALSIIREVSEIILFVLGTINQADNIMGVLLGVAMGAGIGLSVGIILFYALINLERLWAIRCSLILLALVAGNMAAQAILLLTQADWLPYTPTAWDTSWLISEYTLTGQLLYALIGYEANPSVLQVVAYGLGILSILLSSLFRAVWPALIKKQAA